MSSKAPAEFYLEFEELPSKDNDSFPVKRYSLRNDEGVSITRTEAGAVFQYADNDLVFRFMAMQEGPDNEPDISWVVYLGIALNGVYPEPSLAKVHEIANNIEAALKCFPRGPDKTALKPIHFLMNQWEKWEKNYGKYLQ